MTKPDVTTNDIMEFLQEHMVTKEELQSELSSVKKELRDEMNSMHNGLITEIRGTELKLLDAMDEKLTNLKGDLIVMMRGEDQKLTFLIKKMLERKLLSEQDANEILSLHPFPQSTRSL